MNASIFDDHVFILACGYQCIAYPVEAVDGGEGIAGSEFEICAWLWLLNTVHNQSRVSKFLNVCSCLNFKHLFNICVQYLQFFQR